MTDDKSAAPKRLWIRYTDNTVMRQKPSDPDKYDLEFVRADLLQEAWNAALREAHKVWEENTDNEGSLILALIDTPVPPTPAEPADALREAVRAAFDAGCKQGSDEAISYDWGAAPDRSRDDAFSDFMADWNHESAPIRAALTAAPAPQPTTTDREALVEVIHSTMLELDLVIRPGVTATIADALLARGLHLPTEGGKE